MWASVRAQLLALVGGEIDHQQGPAGRQHARRLGDRGGRRMGIMKHLVDDDRCRPLRRPSGSAYMSPWRRLDAMPAASSLTRASRSISDERSMPMAWLARGPNSSIIRPVPVPMSTSRPSGRVPSAAVDRLLDLAFGDVERADLVPHLGMAGEIAVGGLGALGADRLGARGVGGEQRAGSRASRPASISANIGSTALGVGERQEHPAALLAPLEHAGIGEDLQVARHARLALPEHLRQLADRQLHQPQQRDDAQPGRVGKRLEAVGKRKSGGHQIRI